MSNPILATGHADLVSTPGGDWYVVFLATRPQNPNDGNGKPQLGRETFLAPVTWEDDWPVVNNGNDITFDIPGLYDLARPKKWRDSFNRKLVDKAYYTPRTPYKKFYDLGKRKGWCRLNGNPYTLSDRETPAVLLRKQVDLNTVFSTEARKQVNLFRIKRVLIKRTDRFQSNKYHARGRLDCFSEYPLPQRDLDYASP
jgi:beta-xylosidase